MPPLVVTPLIKWTFAAIGGAAIMHWMVKEVRRINEELDRIRTPSGEQQLAREPLPTLRRDPRSGEWRVM